jgi:hypothetical protein
VTDGIQTKGKGSFIPLQIASSGLQVKGVHVYSLGVGKNADVLELLDIASTDDAVFSTRNFDDLTNTMVEPIQTEMCKGILTLLTSFMTKHGLLREKVTY